MAGDYGYNSSDVKYGVQHDDYRAYRCQCLKKTPCAGGAISRLVRLQSARLLWGQKFDRFFCVVPISPYHQTHSAILSLRLRMDYVNWMHVSAEEW